MTSKLKKDLWKPNKHRFQALPVLLLRAKDATSQNIRPVLRDFGFTEQRWRIIRALYDAESLSAGELAEEVFLSMTSISRITKQLFAEKLITRANDTADKRSIRFSITKKGQKLCSKIGPALEAKHTDTFNKIDNVNIEELEKKLDILIEELGGMAVPGG